jgi:hypothetical protein
VRRVPLQLNRSTLERGEAIRVTRVIRGFNRSLCSTTRGADALCELEVE